MLPHESLQPEKVTTKLCCWNIWGCGYRELAYSCGSFLEDGSILKTTCSAAAKTSFALSDRPWDNFSCQASLTSHFLSICHWVSKGSLSTKSAGYSKPLVHYPSTSFATKVTLSTHKEHDQRTGWNQRNCSGIFFEMGACFFLCKLQSCH